MNPGLAFLGRNAECFSIAGRVMAEVGVLCSYTYASKGTGMFSDIPANLSHSPNCPWWPAYRTCPGCGADLDRKELAKQVLDQHQRDSYWYSKTRIVALASCQTCGWWFIEELHNSESSGAAGRSHAKLIFGEAKHYALNALDAPLESLRRYLRKHPHDLAHINPQRFEILMRDCLRDAYGPVEVIHTGGTGDGGIDLKMVLTHDETYLVQVKRRSGLTKKEGIKTVRELNGVLFREGIPRGMVITTALGFTRGARQEADISPPSVETYEMKLLSFDDVVSMLRLPARHPYEPWARFLKDLGIEPDVE